MTGRIVVNHFGRDHLFGADDLICAAIERVVRKRLTDGRSMFLAATSTSDSGRERACAILTPYTHLMFTYTDLGDADLTATTAEMQRYVDLYGGIELDENDLPIDPR